MDGTLQYVMAGIAFLVLGLKVYRMLTRRKKKYIGERNKKGKRHGQGTQFYQNGHVFKGTFNNDKMVKGTYSFGTKAMYVGTFNKKQQKEGKNCVEVYEDGITRYEGEFSQGERSGRGTMTMKSGATYTGQWLNGKKNGKGVHKTRTYSYSGNFVKGQRQGRGVATYDSGDFKRYEGMWSGNRWNGRGKLTLRDGSTWEGRFSNNAQIGKGLFLSAEKIRSVHEYDGSGRLVASSSSRDNIAKVVAELKMK